ncbi:TATA element modulatory factor-like isoform X2 [Cimex lectularius]|uniref:TATA element modulatory factor 1 TATA binding domain-containing protein n=1 Tax=Cimex lectularius TaxID=79782 RepID=A0A8I6S5C4_CIMLE|nr:TATA element modulatory factor-like isoform X2 [Cimex lectularius]
MSWFDTTGFATLAKSALKEAQKTIDKALDIQDEEGAKTKQSPTWGLQSGSSQSTPGAITKEVVSPSVKMPNSTSLWGSFTGSFFDNQSKPEGTKSGDLVSDQPKKSTPPRSLSLDLSKSLYTVQSEARESPEHNDDIPDGEQIKEEIKNFPQVEVVMRKKEQKNVASRLSVISSESDRRSTDSCDVIGSTPDSDHSISASSSVARLRQSGSFESVEVLTSPSSVDVLGSHSTESGDKGNSSDSVSPIAEGEGVEVIPEDEDDISVEDSNTSASENTLTMTVLEHSANAMLKSTSSLETSFTEAMSPREAVNRPITGFVLTHAVVQEGGGDAKIKKDTKILKKDEVVTEAPKLSQSRVSECLSDPAESSCEEGTIMGSSDEGSNLRGSVVTTLIADAMTEPSAIIREQSPISSERSDLVKIGSSEQTSGDELETTTSSDIEIISSTTPNGSNASTRLSPTKNLRFNDVPNTQKPTPGKIKGHHREPSEASSGGSEEGNDVEKLLKRISEMSELLQARETKLLDLSRANAALHESNSSLKSQLEVKSEQQDLKNISEEFTQRLAALERKFQQAIREKEAFRKQLDQAKAEIVLKEEDAEKDQVIEELRQEGEKLSKQHLVLNNTIKKLRATEKENSKVISTLNDQLGSTRQELERSKKTMSAKEEMERSHIEAVHNLKKQVLQLEKELITEKGSVSSLTASLIASQKELKMKSEALSKAESNFKAEKQQMENSIKSNISLEIESAQVRITTFQSALEDMRKQMIQEQEKHSKIEMTLRQEMSELLKRAECAERRLEDESQALKSASQPLARQLQSLTEAHSAAQQRWERQEALLNSSIADLEAKVVKLTSSERNVRHQHEASSARLSELMNEVITLREQNNALLSELNLSQENLEKVKVLKNSETKKFQLEKERLVSELEEKKREIISLKDILSVEKAALDAEKRKNIALQEQLRVNKAAIESAPMHTPRSSPCSLKDSIESESALNWFGEEQNEMPTPRFYEVLKPSNNTSFIENLQSQLKLKEGEVHQLQWEVARMESERTSLRDEIMRLSSQLEVQSSEVKSLETLKTQYDALLQMYGEKVEETQELKMDLQDMKEMYKAQIDELLKREEPKPNVPS